MGHFGGPDTVEKHVRQCAHRGRVLYRAAGTVYRCAVCRWSAALDHTARVLEQLGLGRPAGGRERGRDENVRQAEGDGGGKRRCSAHVKAGARVFGCTVRQYRKTKAIYCICDPVFVPYRLRVLLTRDGDTNRSVDVEFEYLVVTKTIGESVGEL